MANEVGRPTIYNINFHPQEAEKLAGQGLIDMEICKGLGICSSTFYEWSRNHTEFAESIKRGKAIADQEVVGSLYNRARGFFVTETKTVLNEDGSKRVEQTQKWVGDTTAAIYWTKNRLPKEFRDKQETEISSAEDKPFVVKVLRGVSMDDL